MKSGNIVLLILFGTLIGLLLYPIIFPIPELPEPELIHGDTVVVYKDTTVYDTVTQTIPVEVEVTPERNIISIDEPVELFSGAVTFRLWSRDVEVEGIRITNARLHLQETQITITDTLRVPYAVEVPVKLCLLRLFGACVIPNNFTAGFVGGAALMSYLWKNL